MTPNRDIALALMGRRPRRERAAAILAGGICRIVIDGEIDQNQVAAVRQKLAAQPHAGTLEITINSAGGNLDDAFSLFDLIRSHGATSKITIAETECSSAAVLVFAAGDIRRMHANCHVVMHGVALEPAAEQGRWTARRYDTHAKRIATLDAGYAATLADRTGAAISEIEREMANERPSVIARLKALKIATEIYHD